MRWKTFTPILIFANAIFVFELGARTRQTDGRTDGRTDRQTDGRTGRVMRPRRRRVWWYAKSKSL